MLAGEGAFSVCSAEIFPVVPCKLDVASCGARRNQVSANLNFS